jgi:hypothetical protein
MLLQQDSDGRWRFSLPTKNLQPGRYNLVVVVTDRVGPSRSKKVSLTIAPPKPS